MPAGAEPRIAQFTKLVATAISNIHARAEERRLSDQQAALRRVATIVARECSPEEVFVTVAEEVGVLLGADSGSINRFEPDGYCTVLGSWGKLRDAFKVGSRWKLDGDSVSASVYRTGRPVRLDSYERGSGSMAAAARGAGVHSSVAGPIVINGRRWGALVAATAQAEPMATDAESQVAQFAELVATSISNAQARSDLAASRSRIAAATDEERRRVVRDLHDGPQRGLVHTILSINLARRELERDGEAAAELVGDALESAQAATDELRELAHGILPSVLTHEGLWAGIRALTSRMSIPVETAVSVGRLAPEIEASAYFVVAEALTSAAKRSNAQRAWVTARLEHAMLLVEVRDDGIGGAQAPGTGLVGLRDRLAVLDGTLRVETPAGRGTVVAAAIPIR
jgi:signal transduction histidine kinase